MEALCIETTTYSSHKCPTIQCVVCLGSFLFDYPVCSLSRERNSINLTLKEKKSIVVLLGLLTATLALLCGKSVTKERPAASDPFFRWLPIDGVGPVITERISRAQLIDVMETPRSSGWTLTRSYCCHTALVSFGICIFKRCGRLHII